MLRLSFLSAAFVLLTLSVVHDSVDAECVLCYCFFSVLLSVFDEFRMLAHCFRLCHCVLRCVFNVSLLWCSILLFLLLLLEHKCAMITVRNILEPCQRNERRSSYCIAVA